MGNEDQDITGSVGERSALRVLAPPYLGLLMLLLISAWSIAPAPEPSLDARLQEADPQDDLALLQAEILRADSGRALGEDDEAWTQRFLDLQAQAAGMHITEVTFRSGVARDGVQPVDALFELQGDPYHLPIFLDGLYRQRAINHPLSIKANGQGRTITFALVLRYYRPMFQDTAWVGTRLEAQHPEHVQYAPVLESAALLAEWRAFQEQEFALLSRAGQIRTQMARELTPTLISLRQNGGSIQWHDTLSP